MANLPAIVPDTDNTVTTLQDDQTRRAMALVDDDVRKVHLASKSENTLKAYQKQMTTFASWCQDKQVSALPALPETIAAYLVHRMKSGLSAATIEQALAAIRHFHREAGQGSPTGNENVKSTMRGIRRTIGTKQTQKQPATAERIAAMVAHMPTTMKGKRDRALILLGMAGAFRRSELVSLNIEDLQETENGLDVSLGRSKTDQEGQGYLIAIPHGQSLKPVQAVMQWIEAAVISSGPLFRAVSRGGNPSAKRLSDHSVALIVKQYADLAGMDPKDLSGHSLRAGFVTSAAERSVDLNRIMDQTRHVDPRTVRTYIRRAERYKDHAGAGFL